MVERRDYLEYLENRNDIIIRNGLKNSRSTVCKDLNDLQTLHIFKNSVPGQCL